MKMLRRLEVLAVLSPLFLALPALASSDAKSDTTAQKTSSSTKKPSFESSATATATVTVDSVDLKKRTITFHTPSGELETVEVGKKVKNLDRVKPGDELTVTYREYSRLSVYPAGAVLPQTEAGEGMATASQGEKPATVAGAHFTMTATVEKLDKKTGKVTLKGENGETRTLTARNKKNLQNVEVGDQVVLTHEKAIAASVKTPKSGA
ncbi:MAG TPA: hypothetical protein VFG53_12980 [Anaeromyxobacter sp.]|nr:hypothetical protein [Anaeromyxobacter sp.]